MSIVPHAAEATAGTTLAKGAVISTVGVLASNLRGLFTLLVARLLGDTALGTFGVAWAVMDLSSKLGTLGLDYRATALIASAASAGDRAHARRLFRESTRIALLAGVAVAVCGATLAALGSRLTNVAPDFAWVTAVLFVAVPGLAVYRVSNAASRGMKAMQHDIYSRGLTDSLVTAGGLLALVYFGAGPLAPALAACAGALASGLVAWVLANRLFPPGAETPPGAFTRRIVWDAWPVAVYDFLNIAIMRLDVVLLGLFIGRAPDVTLQTVGIYAASAEVAGGLRKVSQVFTPIFMPVLAEQLAGRRIREAEQSYAYVARWMLAILLPAVVVLTLAGGAILRLFGPSFPRGATWLAIVGGACALNAFVRLGETMLLVARPRWNLVNAAVASVVAVVLSLYLIPRYGPIGAAIGMLVPHALQGVLRAVVVARVLDWQWPWRALVRPWTAALCALPFGVLVLVATSGLAAEIAAACAYLLVYVATWYYLGLDPSDRALLERLRHRKSRELTW